MRLPRSILTAIVISVTLVVGAFAQENIDPVVEEKSRDVFLSVMSPFCPGQSLADCPSGKAHDLKDEIREEVKSGKSKEAILDRIFSKYGETYRAMPKVEGIGIVAWFAPVIFFVLGATVIGFWLAKRARIAAPSATASRPVSKEIDERVAREIQNAIDE